MVAYVDSPVLAMVIQLLARYHRLVAACWLLGIVILSNERSSKHHRYKSGHGVGSGHLTT